MNVEAQRNYGLEAAYDEAAQRFTANNPKSKSVYDAACAALPGGNSRTVLFYNPFPLTLAKGEGCYVWDVDSHKYADFVGEYTAGLYGHSNPKIIAAVKTALDNGIVLGGHNETEAKLAQMIVDRWPSVERVRFTNSGTESNMMAIVTARAVTGRSKVMVMEGGYHGGVLSFRPGGTPVNAPFDYVVADYNDPEGARKLIAEHGDDLACVVIEPMAGGAGCIPATREFLQTLRDETAKRGVILIFDEVMTSRLAPGGAQEIHNVMPDMTTFGKYIGGGLTFGAFAGRADIMDRYDPRKPDAYPHAGTFNQNVLTMAAGYTGLSQIYTPEVAVAFNARGDKLRARLQGLADKHALPIQITGMGSMMCVHFNRKPIHSIADAYSDNGPAKDMFHLDMLARDHYIARRGMLVLSLPMGDAEFDGLAAAFEDFLVARKDLLSQV
jgi:glutamate-1-semialdehyde 2,1-aminomutase